MGIEITLNHFDDEGQQVDTTTEEIEEHQLSDITDHATQLIVVLQAMEKGEQGIEAFDAVIGDLKEAVVTAGLAEEGHLPTLHLVKH